MKIGVVVSCYRQERFLARTVAAIETAFDGEDWQGVLELAVLSGEPLPPLSERWRVVSAFDPATRQPGRPLTPGGGRMLGYAACGGDWVLFADSDIEMEAAWVRAAIALAGREPALAAVFGRLEEWFVDGGRERPGNPDMYRTGPTDRPVDYLAAVASMADESEDDRGGCRMFTGAQTTHQELMPWTDKPTLLQACNPINSCVARWPWCWPGGAARG